jgi:hypothetical protein
MMLVASLVASPEHPLAQIQSSQGDDTSQSLSKALGFLIFHAQSVTQTDRKGLLFSLSPSEYDLQHLENRNLRLDPFDKVDNLDYIYLNYRCDMPIGKIRAKGEPDEQVRDR